jgi:hypothetical protein
MHREAHFLLVRPFPENIPKYFTNVKIGETPLVPGWQTELEFLNNLWGLGTEWE